MSVSLLLRNSRGTQGNAKAQLAIVNRDIPTNNYGDQVFVRMDNSAGDADVYFSIMDDESQINYGQVHAGITFAETDTFKVTTQHPNGIDGFRDQYKEAHLMASAFSYNVEDDAQTDQFNAFCRWVTIKDGQSQQSIDLVPTISRAQTGNTQTKFVRIIEAAVALTRCSDLVFCIKAGHVANITFQVAAIARATK